MKIFGLDSKENHKEIMEKTGVVLDTSFIVEDWKVGDTEKYLKDFYANWDTNLFNKYLKQFEISKEKKIKELSKGMNMKFIITLALAQNPKLLVLDEPSSGLDPVARYELLEILQEFILDGEKSVIFSTHITQDLEKIADFIVFINEGEIAYKGEKDKLKESFLLIKADDLDSNERAFVKGLKDSNTHIEGLINIDDKDKFNSPVVFEKPSLDDIMIYLYRDRR